MKDWIHELRKNGTVDMVIAIAGNKCDLEDLREVRTKGMVSSCTAKGDNYERLTPLFTADCSSMPCYDGHSSQHKEYLFFPLNNIAVYIISLKQLNSAT